MLGLQMGESRGLATSKNIMAQSQSTAALRVQLNQSRLSQIQLQMYDRLDEPTGIETTATAATQPIHVCTSYSTYIYILYIFTHYIYIYIHL